MRVLICILFAIVFGNAEIIERFTKPENCKSCHNEQFSVWKTSLHSLSHEKNNELYEKSVKFVSLETSKGHAEVLVSCSNCHNPRLEIKEIDDVYTIAKTFDLKTQKTEKIDEALGVEHIQNGISCYICHNVDNIKIKNSENQVGYKNFEWTKDETIVGPYEDPDNRAGFHKSSQREYFVNGNDLCLSCHQGTALNNPLAIYNTGDEHLQSGDAQRCVDCHMKPTTKGVISPHSKPETAKVRNLRAHLFAGVRNSSELLNDSLKIDLKKTAQNKANLNVVNLTSHNLPSGFSGRNMTVKVTFYDKNAQELNSKDINFEKIYHNKFGVITLSYSADKLISDTTLKAYEDRNIEIDAPLHVSSAKVEVLYYVLSPKLQERIIVNDEKYTKPYQIYKATFSLN
ncbi:multiheme c-type cytochrome [Campylobacter ureolyticus]|uniref:multiheme c-type cytochrome n=1 Tax=Campylobacter ureolyticus TaxID=827 RepID=UPI0029062C77|nr:multiheme c-type cytochrome [Campylobacter ureolyticus]MDU7069989.1 multiheme c-type cytochrome [Campylobacter ureolyticus]